LLGFEPLNLLLDSLILLQLFDVCPATMQVGAEEKTPKNNKKVMGEQ